MKYSPISYLRNMNSTAHTDYNYLGLILISITVLVRHINNNNNNNNNIHTYTDTTRSRESVVNVLAFHTARRGFESRSGFLIDRKWLLSRLSKGMGVCDV